MNDDSPGFWIVVCVVVVAVVIFWAWLSWRDGYRSGQIDALTGNIKYELVTQPNGETVWVERGGANVNP